MRTCYLDGCLPAPSALVPIVFLFPDGRLPSRRWMVPFVLAMTPALLAALWLAVEPGPMLPSGAPSNPFGWPGLYDPIARLGTWFLVMCAAGLMSGIVAMFARVWDADGADRRRLLLVALAALILVAELLHEDFASYAGEEWAGAAVTVLFAAAIAIAILRYGLYEIDLVVSRTLVYGGVTLVLGGAYAGIVTAAGMPAAVAVAVLFAPVRAWLQRASDRLLFGDRGDPYAVIATVGRRLDGGEVHGRAAVLPALASTIAQTLKLSYVAIELGGTLAAECGRPAAQALTLPLHYGGVTLGQLSLCPRDARDRVTAGEQTLLEDVARQVAVAAHAVALTDDLERSRRDLVTAREEERRRVRRDLHDGLGPSLAGISLQLASARMLLHRDLDAADALLTALVDETQTAITDVRRLVYALRPPALDELGLVPALRMQAERFPGLQVSVHAPESVDQLPAAVEVAAYRIATEALTNVSRHAAATECTIDLRMHDRLELEVSDDGIGLATGWRPGIGVNSIRERAIELGGSCVIEGGEGGGTRVSASLPLPVDL